MKLIEKIVLDYLNSVLDVPVYMEKPEDEPMRYVLVEKTGSNEEDYIFVATIAIQSYAESLYQVAVLNEIVKSAMYGIVKLNSIGKAKLNTDYNFTDTTKKKYRYQAIYDITY